MTNPRTRTRFDNLMPGYHMDRRLGVVYESSPRDADDLTVIRGIGTREAVQLNQCGVYYLLQIAVWTSDQIEAVAPEVGITASAIRQEQWVEQACQLTQPIPEDAPPAQRPPASGFRTAGFVFVSLATAVLILFWMNNRREQQMHGILAAEITSLKVPADARLLSLRVSPGDEVFTGEALATLEKEAHLQLLREQEDRVAMLTQRLAEARAGASLLIEQKTLEADRQISELNYEIRYLDDDVQTAEAPEAGRRSASTSGGMRNPLRPVSQSRPAEPAKDVKLKPAGMIYFAGASGTSSIDVRPPAERVPVPPPAPAPNPIRILTQPDEAIPASMISANTRRLQEARDHLERLRKHRDSLSDQILRSSGVDALELDLAQQTERLEQMQAADREVELLSPAYGILADIRVAVGEPIRRGETILRLLHKDRRYVTASVPTDRIHEMGPEQRVRLTFPGKVERTGRVVRLPLMAEPADARRQTFVTVRIEQIGRHWPDVPIGSRIDVEPRE